MTSTSISVLEVWLYFSHFFQNQNSELDSLEDLLQSTTWSFWTFFFCFSYSRQFGACHRKEHDPCAPKSRLSFCKFCLFKRKSFGAQVCYFCDLLYYQFPTFYFRGNIYCLVHITTLARELVSRARLSFLTCPGPCLLHRT